MCVLLFFTFFIIFSPFQMSTITKHRLIMFILLSQHILVFFSTKWGFNSLCPLINEFSILLPSLKDESDLLSSLILCEWSGVNSELRTVVLCLIKSDKIWEQIIELVSLLLIWVCEEKCVELQQRKENFKNFF